MSSQKNKTHGEIDTEVGTQRGLSAQDAALRGQSRSGILGAATGLMNSGYSPELEGQVRQAASMGGYSPETKSYIQQQTLGGVGETYDKARDQMTLRAARTGNSAGVNASMEDIAREEAKSKADISQRNMLGFADEERNRQLINLQMMKGLEDERQRRQEAGTGVLGDIYKTDAGLYGAGRDTVSHLLGTKAGLASQPGILGSILGGAATVGGAALGGGLGAGLGGLFKRRPGEVTDYGMIG